MTPAHVYENKDEIFYVLDGELTFWLGDRIETATKNAVKVRIHYQRANVRVAPASSEPRLTASEIPKS